MNKIVMICFLVSCLNISQIYCQDLHKIILSGEDSLTGALYKYEWRDTISVAFDGVIMYKSGAFYYYEGSGGHSAFSRGQWTQDGEYIILNSDFMKDRIPISLRYLGNDDTARKIYRTKFQVPVNSKGERFPDSRIYINSDSTYCFPYFDTCIGQIVSIDSIKVDFGNGYKTGWVHLRPKGFYKLQIIANVDFLFESYVPMNNRRYKTIGSTLKYIDEK